MAEDDQGKEKVAEEKGEESKDEAADEESKKDDSTMEEKETSVEKEDPKVEKEEGGTNGENDAKEEEDEEDDQQRPKKRARKSAEAFRPDDFTIRDIGVKIFNGRGVQLSQIASIRENINECNNNSYEIGLAHKFLYTYRGKIPNKVKKGDILSFSGYLTPKVKGEDKTARKKEDNDNEKKMSVKAFKLKVNEIKTLCDMFDVDRSAVDGKALTKDDLIDRLLDFLSAPDKKLTKSFSKQKAKVEKKAKKETPAKKQKEEEKEEEEEEEEKKGKDIIIKGKMPTDKQLRKWVQAYVRCFDLDKATTKHAIATASDKFGTDLASKKARIKEMLAEEM